LAKRASKVIAIEPYFSSYLEENLTLNNVKNVKIEKVFLSDKKENVTLWTSASGCNNTRTIATMFKGAVKESMVETTTLDDVLSEKVDFIKIDTDGSDAKVILGGKQLINKYKPVILFEICGTRTKEYESTLNEAVSYLEDMGYRLYIIDDNKISDFSLPPVGIETNVLATLRDKTVL
jgi:FkbM family methyltransferase